ncbi:Transcription initiation factor TFIID subunit 9 [Gnomoniopsis sp. IMI 355080]|nr:Transcription initiation factor TFIID subunit 9 [Gnomoniopsis sp. IMI 355080]
MSAAAPQTNGVPPSSPGGSASQTIDNTQPASASQSQPTTNGVNGASQPSQSQPQASTAVQPANPATAQQAAPNSPTVSAPKPRDQRTIELLLHAQGVTAFESRVPQLLLDFAYRHTSSVLSDSLYLGADPYVTHAGAKPSASSGAAASLPGTGGDATVSANAIRLAIASRLAYQFHGGGGATGGGGISKDALAGLAAEKNKIGLPRVPGNDWGIRLPNERFVMTGQGWEMDKVLSRTEDDSEDEDEDMADAMDVQVNDEDVGGDGVEGGTMEDLFGNNEQVGEEDVDMGGAD